MNINLSPQPSGRLLTVEKKADALIINGEGFDFGSLPEGALISADAIPCHHLIEQVERIDGEIHLTLLVPIDVDAPYEARFPEPIGITKDGTIALPCRPMPVSNQAPPMWAPDPSIIVTAEQRQAATEPTELVTILYPADLWRRTSTAEAEMIEAALSQQSLRVQNIFRTAREYRSDDELWSMLEGMGKQLFGEERAAELLAPS